MKTKLFIIGLFLFALAACVKVPEPAVAEHGRSVEGPSPELCAIDSLLWRQPDSALACLLPYFDTCIDTKFCVSTATAYNRHYAHLLLSELLYKNDYPQTNRAELQRAVAYFDSISQVPEPVEGPSNRIAFLDARAHYINGVGYYENDSVVSACKEYMRALDVMEGRFKEKELVGKKAKFMALTYTRLSSLFSDMYLHEQAIYFAQLSLASNQELDVPSWHNAWLLCEIGIHYDIMERLDSADYYYKNATTLLNDTNCLLYRDISARQTVLKYKMRGLQKNTLTQLRHLINLANSKTECILRSFTIGEIFYLEKQPDSAWYYLNNVYNNTEKTAMKKQTAEWLVEICKIQGRDNDILEYADFLVPFANQEENQSAVKSQLTELYKTHCQTRLKKEHQQEMGKQFKFTMFVILVLLVVLLIIGLLYRRSSRGKKHLETMIETERNSHKMQQAALAGRLKRSNAALKEQEKTASSINPLSFTQQPNGVESYVEEPICQQILAVCNDKNNSFKSNVPVSAYSNIALTDAQKAQLKNAALRHYSSLFEKLRLQHPEMKEKDFLYCYLCLLGLDNIQIAVLLQNSISTIWEREKRLKTIFGSENRIAIILHEYMIN